VLIADGAESFADAVLRLCTDDRLWRCLSNAGREHVSRHYSPAAIAPRVRALLAPAETPAVLTP
jgi:O-antigen biosynthesis protein